MERKARRDIEESVSEDEDYQPNQSSHSNEHSNEHEENNHSVNNNNMDTTKLNEIQALVCECISDNSGSCHFDLIVHHVSKHWPSISAKYGNVDVRTAILNVLTDSNNRLFKRDSKRTGWWMINNAVLKSKVSTNTTTPTTSAPITSPLHNNNKEQQDNSNDSGEEDSQLRGELTELQILIMHSLYAEGGTATFEQIYEHVIKKYDSIRRRDGTPYTSDCKRAISSSLSNNSSAPFFKKENRKGVWGWSLTKKAVILS